MSEEDKIDTKVFFLSHTLSLKKVSCHQWSAAARTETTHVTPAPALLNECYKYQSKMQQNNLNTVFMANVIYLSRNCKTMHEEKVINCLRVWARLSCYTIYTIKNQAPGHRKHRNKTKRKKTHTCTHTHSCCGPLQTWTSSMLGIFLKAVQ